MNIGSMNEDNKNRGSDQASGWQMFIGTLREAVEERKSKKGVLFAHSQH